MATLNISQKAALDNLLAKGETTEAAKFLASLEGGSVTAPDEPPAPPEPPKPREPSAVILDALHQMHALLGNNPSLDKVMAELDAVLSPPAPDDKA